MSMHKSQINRFGIAQVSLWLIGLFVLLTSLVSLPITTNFVQDTKYYLITNFALLATVVYVFQSLKNKSFRFVLPPFFLPLLACLASVVASTTLTAPYPIEGLMGWGGVYISFVLIVLFAGQLLPKLASKFVGQLIAAVAAINVVGAGLQLVGFGPAQLYNHLFKLQLPVNLGYSLAGGAWLSLQLVLLGLGYLIHDVIKTKKVSIFGAVVIPILIIGVGVFGWNLRPNGPTPLVNLSHLASWSVALDNLRVPKTALIGSGPESYSNVYRLYKPTWMNSAPNWNLIYGSASNLPLHLLTTMGSMGLFVWLWLIIKIGKSTLKNIKEHKESTLVTPLIFSLILNLFFPENILLIGLQAIMLASIIAEMKDSLTQISFSNLQLAVSSSKGKSSAEAFEQKNHITSTYLPVYFLGLVVFLIVGFGFFGLYRGYYSQILMRQADIAIQNNQASVVYELQQKAVRLNPYYDVNRRAYGLTNLMITSALANKTDATDQEKEQVNLLIQQATREASAATVLDPQDSQNWQVLANVYSNMVGLAEDAQQWAVQTYVNAIQTYPSDPNLRISLGGLLLSTNQLDQAISVFTGAINVKPDYANSYYNLAYTLRQSGKLEDAMSAYQQALTLIDPSSEDFIKLTQEIETFEKQLSDKAKDASITDAQAPTTPIESLNSITNQQLDNNPNEIIAPQSEGDAVVPESNLSVEPKPSASVVE